jgi:transposase
MTLLQQNNLELILIMIYCFVDNTIKMLVQSIVFSLQRPGKNLPPLKKHNLALAELVSLAIFRFFTGHRNWKDFYRHIETYHAKDFPQLPTYRNFIEAINKLSSFASILLNAFMEVFRNITPDLALKFADSSRLRVCDIKREWSHKVCKGLAKKSKSTMGWFYGFKLHIICNELMQILNFTITPATTDDRRALETLWDDIFGMIIADAGYVGKDIRDAGLKKGKFLFAAVRANMKKVMTEAQHQLFRLREVVERVFSVLKLRMGLETSLPRSPLGHFAHYLWCLTAYQMKKFFELVFSQGQGLLA